MSRSTIRTSTDGCSKKSRRRYRDTRRTATTGSRAGFPLGRAGQVSKVVDAVLSLASSPYITGEILHADGSQVDGH
jgi:NAD(P)-dependent dehydrogenase (short-subunit alcohol dehydrogenase family)